MVFLFLLNLLFSIDLILSLQHRQSLTGDLAGKKIVLAPNTKHGADLFLDEVAELLMSKYPTATITLLKPGVKAKVAAKQCDVFIHSTGD